MCSNNITSVYIDMATFDDIEERFYTGEEASTYFVSCIRASTWFSQIPTTLSTSQFNNGNAFGSKNVHVNIGRAGDYLLHHWIRGKLSSIDITNPMGANLQFRWTRNFMHNFFQQGHVKFSEISAQCLNNFILDFYINFTTPESKWVGYNVMIGNIAELTVAHNPGNPTKEMFLNLPVPWFFTRDTGVALPASLIPYNDAKFVYDFRDWRDLLIIENQGNPPTEYTGSYKDVLVSCPSFSEVQFWANFAIVTNEERLKMGKCPRDIVIEQWQFAFAPVQIGTLALAASQDLEFTFAYAVKAIFFGYRNVTIASEWSNYSTVSYGAGPAFEDWDPISAASVYYDNTARLDQMGADFYSLVDPWYKFIRIPTSTGYHGYSYSLDPIQLDPMGSTNFGRLSRSRIRFYNSPEARESASDQPPTGTKQLYEGFIIAWNLNIITVVGGGLGFPHL